MPDPRELRWLPDALQDLIRLDNFIRPHNPDAANRAIHTIRDAAESLLENPELGRPWDPAPEFRQFFIPFGARGYVLRYRLEDHRIVIVRIWHTREDR